MEEMREPPPVVSPALRRFVRRRRLAGAVVLLAGLGVAGGGVDRARTGREVRRRGMRLNAVVLATLRAPLADRVLLRYDVDDGRLLRADVAVPNAAGYRVGDTVRAAYDPRHPGWVRLMGVRDPLPPVDAGGGAALALLGATVIGLASGAARRARRSAGEPGASMRATFWRGNDGRGWVRLDHPAAPDAPQWWVRLLPGEEVSELLPEANVSVRGALGARAPVAVEVGGTILASAWPPTTGAPRGAVQVFEPPFRARSRPSDAGIAAAVTFAVAVAASVAYVTGPGRRASLDISADLAAPACAGVERLLGGRSSTPDAGAPTLFDQTSVLQLPGLLPSQPPAGLGFDRVPPAADSFLSLAQAAATRRDPEEGERVLRRYGYVGGYRRDWTSGGRLLTVFAYEFSSPANAAAFDAYASRYVCVFDAEAFAFPDLPGAIGNRILTRAGGVLEQVSFVRGARRYLAGMTFGASVPGHADVHALAAAETALAH